MTTKPRARPWAKKKAARSHLSPDQQWAAEICARIDADCHPRQYDAVNDPARRVSLLVGRGGTKTSTMRARALKKLVSIPNGDILYGALTRPSAEKLNWFPLKKAIFAYGLSDEFELSDYKLRARCIRTGAIYTLTGMQDDADIEGFRGQPFDEVQVDEAASHDPDRLGRFIDDIVGPRLGERRGCLVLGGTPGRRPRGIFYDATRPGSCREDGSPIHRPYADRDGPGHDGWEWSSHAWKLADVVGVTGPQEKKIERDLRDDLDVARDAALEGRDEAAGQIAGNALAGVRAAISDYARQRYPALVANYEEALIQKEKKRYSDDHPVWLREWCGIWASDDTTNVFQYRRHKDVGGEQRLWNMWDPFGDGPKLEGMAMLRAALAALPTTAEGVALRDWRHVLFNDMGSAHPFASNVFSFAPADPTRTLWHTFCFERTGMYPRVIADLTLGAEFVDRLLRGEKVDHLKSGGIFGLTGWPDAMGFDADQDTIDELQKVYGMRFEKADRNPNSKHGAIEATNGDFVDGRIRILKDSILEKQLTALQWEEDRFGAVRPSRKQADHCTDCLLGARKLVAALFDSGAIEPERRPTAAALLRRDPLLDMTDDPTTGAYDSLLASPEYGD